MGQILKRYYIIGVLFPSMIGIIATTIFSIIDSVDYKSEWFTSESVIFTSIIFSIIYCAIIGILSLSIFINLFEKIRKSNVLRIFSWFLLPFGFITTVVIHEINFAIKYHSGTINSDFIFVILLNILFILGLIFSYIKFSNKIKKWTNSQH